MYHSLICSFMFLISLLLIIIVPRCQWSFQGRLTDIIIKLLSLSPAPMLISCTGHRFCIWPQTGNVCPSFSTRRIIKRHHLWGMTSHILMILLHPFLNCCQRYIIVVLINCAKSNRNQLRKCIIELDNLDKVHSTSLLFTLFTSEPANCL